MLKRYAIRLYVIVWQMLRVLSGLYLMVRFGILVWIVTYHFTYEDSAHIYEPPGPIVCGKLAGDRYAFSRAYLPFGVEYEKFLPDDSCLVSKGDRDTNIKSIFFTMTWPGLEPADDRKIYERVLDRGGLLVAITSTVVSDNHLLQRRDNLFDKLSFQGAPLVEYDSSLGLHRAEGNEFSWWWRKRRVFWSEESGKITSVTICNWQSRDPIFYACEMTFMMHGGLQVQVTMSPLVLVQWYEIRQALGEFLIKNRKPDAAGLK